jgi:hypothetical protein
LNLFPKAGRGLSLAAIFWCFPASAGVAYAQPMAGGGATNEIRIAELTCMGSPRHQWLVFVSLSNITLCQ